MVLAVTGGIGCGKTHIINIFAAMGVPAYFTDDRAKGLYDTSETLLNSLVELLGDDIVVNGVLQKGVMASKLFNDKELLRKVESVVHPAVIEDFIKWRDAEMAKGAPFVIIESAIFLEVPDMRPLADKVLVVSAPLDLRIKRVKSRSNLTQQQITERIDNQWSDQKRISMADYHICSDESRALIPQIINIFKEMSNGNR